MGFESVGFGAKPEQSKKIDTPDLSRRKFLSFGMKGGEAERNVLEEKSDDVVLSEEVVSVEPEHPEVITRRDVLKALGTGVVGGSLVTGITRTLSAINDAGGIEEIGKKAKRIKEGVTDGRLARYVAERQEESANKEKLEERLDQLKRKFEKTYRISLVFEDNPHFHRADRGFISSEEANLRSKVEAIDWLIGEFRRYPGFMIDELHIPSITIRNNLINGSDGEVGGFAVFDDHSIAINLQDDIWKALQFGRPSPYDTVARTIHHEFFHLFDPICHEGIAESSLVEQQWNDINQAKNLAYLGGAWKSDDTVRPSGFARSYGMKDIREDRATVFEQLAIGGFPQKSLEDDPVLRSKVDAIRQEMFMRSRGAMGMNFFVRFVRLGEDIDWAEKIVKNSRGMMMKDEPLLAMVSDETYSAWQRFHREKTIPDYYKKQKELAE